MGLVKCQYWQMLCGNGWCPWDGDERFRCEGIDKDGQHTVCRFADPKKRYLEGEFKRIEYDGEQLIVGHRIIPASDAMHRWRVWSGIDYLEIDGRVIIDKRTDEGRQSDE